MKNWQSWRIYNCKYRNGAKPKPAEIAIDLNFIVNFILTTIRLDGKINIYHPVGWYNQEEVSV
jgi:hypothetical protein